MTDLTELHPTDTTRNGHLTTFSISITPCTETIVSQSNQVRIAFVLRSLALCPEAQVFATQQPGPDYRIQS